MDEKDSLFYQRVAASLGPYIMKTPKYQLKFSEEDRVRAKMIDAETPVCSNVSLPQVEHYNRPQYVMRNKFAAAHALAQEEESRLELQKQHRKQPATPPTPPHIQQLKMRLSRPMVAHIRRRISIAERKKRKKQALDEQNEVEVQARRERWVESIKLMNIREELKKKQFGQRDHVDFANGRAEPISSKETPEPRHVSCGISANESIMGPQPLGIPQEAEAEENHFSSERSYIASSCIKSWLGEEQSKEMEFLDGERDEHVVTGSGAIRKNNHNDRKPMQNEQISRHRLTAIERLASNRATFIYRAEMLRDERFGIKDGCAQLNSDIQIPRKLARRF